MAERRMFAKKITDDDNFMQLSASAQALYFHLAMSADDDGFCNQIAISMFRAHAGTQDLQSLLDKQYLYQFESGVVVILHWKIHNSIKKDRYKQTIYHMEQSKLQTEENGLYTLRNQNGSNLEPLWNQNGSNLEPQVRLGEVRLGEDSLGKDSPEEEETADSAESAPPPKKRYGEYQNVLLTDADVEKLQAEFPNWQERIERLSAYMASTGKQYKNHLATIRTWARKDAEESQRGAQKAQDPPQEQQRTTSYSLEEIKKLKNCF